jgi:hypothetical protein
MGLVTVFKIGEWQSFSRMRQLSFGWNPENESEGILLLQQEFVQLRRKSECSSTPEILV